jgi:hypothetical protein
MQRHVDTITRWRERYGCDSNSEALRQILDTIARA